VADEGMKNKIILAENLQVLSQLEDASIPLIYIDPPFNTGRTQSRKRISTLSTNIDFCKQNTII